MKLTARRVEAAARAAARPSRAKTHDTAKASGKGTALLAGPKREAHNRGAENRERAPWLRPSLFARRGGAGRGGVVVCGRSSAAASALPVLLVLPVELTLPPQWRCERHVGGAALNGWGGGGSEAECVAADPTEEGRRV